MLNEDFCSSLQVPYFYILVLNQKFIFPFCRSDQESRAIEVCKLMPDVESIQMAIQYAAKIKRLAIPFKTSNLRCFYCFTHDTLTHTTYIYIYLILLI